MFSYFLPFFFVFNFFFLHLDYMYGAETTTMTRPSPENGPKQLKNVIWVFSKPFFFYLGCNNSIYGVGPSGDEYRPKQQRNVIWAFSKSFLFIFLLTNIVLLRFY